MGFHEPGGRLPDPDWMIGDDAARGINQPPENHMPDEQRRKVEQLRDQIASLREEVDAEMNALDFVSIDLDKSLPTMYKAMDKVSADLDDFYADTVGDSWDDETF
jgi:hypothetical protein